jgi:hypothetical protein
VAKEFQLDESGPVPAANAVRPDTELYNSEAFIQNIGEALSRFRLSPHGVDPRRNQD